MKTERKGKKDNKENKDNKGYRGKMWVAKKLFSIYKVNFTMLIILALLSLATWGATRPTVRFQSENYVAGMAPTYADDSALNVSYNYYMDISPTMYGLINVDGTAKSLSQSLQEINRRKEKLKFYTCSYQIEEMLENDFYDFLININKMDDFYNRLTLEKEFTENMSSMDLSDIFTDTYSNGRQFDGNENCVNVIISDLNFIPGSRSGSLDQSSESMQRFAQTMAGNIVTSNLCVYYLKSQFSGFTSDEYQRVGGKTGVNNYPFFVMIFSDNTLIFEEYIKDVETAFRSKGIDYSQKFEIDSDPLRGVHEIAADTAAFHNTDWTTMYNFNYDSNYFKNIDDQALGLRIIENNESSASIQMPVTKLDLRGYYDGDKDNQTELETVIELYDAKLNGYEKCSDISGIKYLNAKMRQYDGEWYLSLDLEIDKKLNGYLNGVFKKYCVLDIRVSIKRPDYSIPQWVNEINREEGDSEDPAKRTDIIQFFEHLIQVKEDHYEETNSLYQRQIGNIQVYINY